MKNLKKEIAFIVSNWDNIPDKFKVNVSKNDSYYDEEDTKLIKGLGKEEHVVVLLLDRQKPSIERRWDFDEERISVNRRGQIIWGFDSGCSCPTPWERGGDCYTCTDTWKEFELNVEKFDHGAIDECLSQFAKIEQSVLK